MIWEIGRITVCGVFSATKFECKIVALTFLVES